MEKRKDRSKLLEDAGNFYKKLFVIYAKHVKSNSQAYDNIEHLQKKASEFLKLVKRASIHDKTGIFSKPIISIASDTIDTVEPIAITVDKVVPNTPAPCSQVAEQSDVDKHNDSDGVFTTRMSNEIPVNDVSKTVEGSVSISSETTIDYYVNSSRDAQQIDQNELSDDNISVSRMEFRPEGYKLEGPESFHNVTGIIGEINQIDDDESVVTSESINETHAQYGIDDKHEFVEEVQNVSCSTFKSTNDFRLDETNVSNFNGRIVEDLCILKHENTKFDTISIHSSNSYNQLEEKEHFDKSSQTHIPMPVANNVKNITSHEIVNYNIYWDSTEIFNKKLSHTSYRIVLTLFVASIVSIGCTTALIFSYNDRLTTVIPLIALCVYGIAFGFIPNFNLEVLNSIAHDWKEQLHLSDTIAAQLPSADWIGNYTKNALRFHYSERLKWMGLLLIGVSSVGVLNKNFLIWPWGTWEWIYTVSLGVTLSLFTIFPMTSTTMLAKFGTHFALKTIFSLYKLQTNGVCSLSLFGESSPFLIKRTDTIPSHQISQIDTNKISYLTLVNVGNDGRFCLFEEDQYMTIYPPITTHRHNNTIVYITGKYMRTECPNFYVFSGGLFDRLLFYYDLRNLFLTNFTIALEFDTKFALDTFLGKLNILSTTDNLVSYHGFDFV